MIKKISLQNTSQFSTFFLDYVAQDEALKPFYLEPPTLAGFGEKIRQSSYTAQQRQSLKDLLATQYESIATMHHVKDNIDAILKDTTYTVTTGHQLNVFTGPLYFIYKIATTINLAKQLATEFPTNYFVPIYWMATEDHDFEEINNFLLFGKTYTWHTKQSGAVGRYNLEGLEEIIEQISDLPHVFIEAYRQQPSLAMATRFFVNEIFGKYGLVVIDADSAAAKQSFVKIAADELQNQTANRIVSETNQKLEASGYKPQAHARAINLFYLKDNMRERIVKEGGEYKVLNTTITFSEIAMQQELQQYPDRFSPNVILRPLYQEALLPNIAYIGGPAEIIYWLQLKPLFDYHQLPFPILVPRNFAMYVPKTLVQKMRKLNIVTEDLFQQEEVLKLQVLAQFGAQIIDLAEERKNLGNIFQSIINQATTIDKSLEGYVLAERHKVEKALEEIEKKFKKGEERKNEDHLKQLANIKAKLLPNGGLQERTENYLNYAINDTAFVDKMVATFDAFDFQFYIVTEDE